MPADVFMGYVAGRFGLEFKEYFGWIRSVKKNTKRAHDNNTFFSFFFG